MRNLLSLLLVVLALGAGSTLALKAAPAPDYFPLGEGFWWKYRLHNTTPPPGRQLPPEYQNINYIFKVTGRPTLEDGSKGWQVSRRRRLGGCPGARQGLRLTAVRAGSGSSRG